jgi:hypothetical protein
MFKSFNVFLSSGVNVNDEWRAGVDLRKTGKNETIVGTSVEYKKDNFEAGIGVSHNLTTGESEVNGKLGNKRLGGVAPRVRFTDRGIDMNVEPYGLLKKVPSYATTAASIIGGIFAGKSALDLYTQNSHSVPEPYKPLGLAIGVGLLVAFGLKMLFNYLGRKN